MNESLYDVLQQYEDSVTAACVEWQRTHGRKITEVEYGRVVESFVRLVMELNRHGELSKDVPFDPQAAIDTAVHHVLDVGFKPSNVGGDKTNEHDR